MSEDRKQRDTASDERREAARARLAAREGERRSPSGRSRRNGESADRDFSAPGALQTVSSGAKTAVSAVASGARASADWVVRHPKMTLAIFVALLLLIAICTVASTCSADNAQKKAEEQRAAYEHQERFVEGEVNLPASLDPGIESKLTDLAVTDERVDWIIRHTEELSVDGETVLKKLLKLTADEPEAIDFVRGFPDNYPQESGEPYGEKTRRGTVPQLYQWDPRWGYTVYSSTAFALTGCCPTCYSMVYMGLTGNNDRTPYDMGVLADELGFMSQFNGTESGFFAAAAPKLGLSVRGLEASEDSLKQALNSGEVVICNVGPGDFTDSTHFILLTDCSSDGDLTVNDPVSAERSGQTWDISAVLSQTIALFAFSR